MYAALGLVILGVLLEFGQLLSVDRFFEIDDMIAHAAGICIGMAFERPMRGLTN
jgi:glycopeptide antibiotics resistance protein